jgi:hypothetical protein
MEACPKNGLAHFLDNFGKNLKSQKKVLKKKFSFLKLQNCPKNGQGHPRTRFHMLRGMHSVGDGRFLDNFGKLKNFLHFFLFLA